MATLNGTQGNDAIVGRIGDDTIVTGAGNDFISDLFGSNTFDAGSGSDNVFAGLGTDLFIHRLGENAGARDYYDGGLGQDTLRLVLTSAEWARADVQADIAAFLAYQTSALNRFLNPLGFSTPFRFKSMDLTVLNIEKIEVSVEGVLLDPRNEAVIARADSLTLTEDTASASIDLLANDAVPDRAVSVTLLNAGTYGTASIAPSLNGAVQTAAFTYVPSSAVQSLRAGESATDTISYKVVDVNGDTSTASVTITVTGVNDAAAITGTASGSVAEDGTAKATGQLAVSDVDTSENQAQARSNVAGAYGTFSVDATGAWTYQLNNASTAVQSLRADQTVTDSFTVQSKDGTASQVVTVTVRGTNDAATIGDPTVATGREDLDVNPNGFGYIDLKGKIAISDVDQGQAVFVSHSGAAGNLGNLTFQPDGSYTYSVQNSAVQYLGIGDRKTDSFTVVAKDGTSKVVQFTITGSNDAAVIGAPSIASVTEDTEVNAHWGTVEAVGKLSIADADQGQARFRPVVYEYGDVAGSLGRFWIQADGTYTYAVLNSAVQYLGAGQTRTEDFTVTALDGTTKTLTFTITGTNDAPVVTGAVTGTASEDGAFSRLSALAKASDVDAGTTLSVVNIPANLPAGVTYDLGTKSFVLDPANAAFQWLAQGATTTVTVAYGVSDGIATTPATASWTVTGTNDAPVVTGTVTGTATEDGTVSRLSALANASDIDTGATLSVVVPANLPAGVTYDAATKSFVLDPSNAAYQSLAQGANTTVIVTYGVYDGIATTPATSTWTVTGTNDAAIITSSSMATLTEGDTPLSTSGMLYATDIDSPATFVAQTNASGSNGYGAFSIATGGAWTYTANSAHDEFQAGRSYTDSIVVRTADGTSTTITVTIDGSNDAPVVTGAMTGAAIEDGASSTLSALASASDIDAGTTLSVVNIPGNLPAGVTFDAARKSFVLDPLNAAYQSLAQGAMTNVTVAYGVSDGIATTPATATWTVTGINDAPVITASTQASAVTKSGPFWSDGRGTILFEDVDVGDQLTASTSFGGAAYFDANGNAVALQPSQIDALKSLSTITTGQDQNAGSITWFKPVADADAGFLAAGETVVLTYTATIDDQKGGTASTPFTVTINGANDVATIFESPIVTQDKSVTEDGGNTNSTFRDPSASGRLAVRDPDRGEGRFRVPASLAGQFGDFSFDAASGVWNYTLNQSKADPLVQDQKVQDRLTVTSYDGTASYDIVVDVTGTNDDAIIGGTLSGIVAEDSDLPVSGKLAVYDLDTDEKQVKAQSNVAGAYGSFSVDAVGLWTYTLNNSSTAVQALKSGQLLTDRFTVVSKDGTSSRVVTVAITGTNDDPVAGDDDLTVSADLTGYSYNADTGHYYKLVSGTGNMTFAAAQTGAATAGGYLATVTSAAENAFVRSVGSTSNIWLGATDTQTEGTWRWIGGPEIGTVISNGATAALGQYVNWAGREPNGGTVENGLIQNTNGSWNDGGLGNLPSGGYVVEIGGRAKDVIAEDKAATISVQMLLGNDSDVDSAETPTITAVSATSAKGATVSLSGGSILYDASASATLQALAAGQATTDTFTYTVSDGKGGTDTASVTVTVGGVNDAAAIIGMPGGLVAEDGQVSATGQITVSDVDTGENQVRVRTNVAGIYGSFSVDATGAWTTGAWTYALNNASSEVQALRNAETRIDSFLVQSSDGTASQVITLIVTGTNDAAAITGTTSGMVMEDGTLTATGKLTVSDVDAGENQVRVQSNVAGTYGSFSVDASGAWTYALNNASSEVQALGADQSVTDSFTVQSSDGTALQAVTVTVKGTKDAVPNVDLANLGTAGFRIDGAAGADRSGWSVSSAGDVNGDGFDDIIVGAHLADPSGKSNAGASYVVFGSATRTGTLDLANLGAAGFRIDGAAAVDYSGYSVSSAGDVNGDGFDDLIVGAYFADPSGKSGAGASTVVYGGATRTGAAAVVDLANLGTAGFRIDGAAAGDLSGVSVSSAGDVNGDGFDDLIVGAYLAHPSGRSQAGASYVVYGGATRTGSLDLANLGTAGFRIDGAAAGDSSGYSVSSAGDVNGDGFDDLIVGAYNADPSGKSNAGASYVVFGSATRTGTLDLANLGTAGFSIDGAAADDYSGVSVSSAGDVNGDGFDDLIVGAYFADPSGKSGAGASTVVYGGATRTGAVDLANLGTAGFSIDGAAAGDFSGYSVSSAGDVNGDGFDDLIVGAYNADPSGKSNAGASYVVFGSATRTGTLDLANLGTAGFRINGAAADDFSGVSVSSAGYVNNDGFDDLIVGAYLADPSGRSQAGASYVIYGGSFGASSAPVTLIGTGGAETLYGGASNDTLSGGGGADLIKAGAGDDILTGGAGGDTLYGGGGSDRFVYSDVSQGVDRIMDFTRGEDRLQVSASGFGGELVAGNAPTLIATSDHTTVTSVSNAGRFIYDNTGANAGTLYWELNGGSGSGPTAIAKLSGTPQLTASDFIIV